MGQKQLLSFARALAFDPAVLVLDEATSSVDTETELLIRDALHLLMAGRTTIAIAHRLSTIQDMDKILRPAQGRAARVRVAPGAAGRSVGIYFKLYQLQYKDQESRTRDLETGRGPPGASPATSRSDQPLAAAGAGPRMGGVGGILRLFALPEQAIDQPRACSLGGSTRGAGR